MSINSARCIDEFVPRRAFLLIALAAFSISVNLRVCDPMLPNIAQDFSVSVGAASAIVAGFAISFGMLQLVFGPVGDRFGKYKVAAITSIAAGIATLVAAVSPSLDVLTIMRIVAGACAAAPIPLAFAWIGDAVPFDRRQAVLAKFLTAQLSGIILGQVAGGVLGDYLGWRAAFVVVGACHILAGVAMTVEVILNRELPDKPACQVRGLHEFFRDVKRIISRPWVRIILLAVFLESFGFFGAFAYIGADLHNRFGLDFAMIGLVLAAFGAGAVMYSLTASLLLQSIGQTGLVVCGGLLIACGYFTLALLPTSVLAPAIMFAHGLGYYMIHNTLQTNATQMAPEMRGLGVSLFTFVNFLGQASGVAMAGLVIDELGTRSIYALAAVIITTVAVYFWTKLRTAQGQDKAFEVRRT